MRQNGFCSAIDQRFLYEKYKVFEGGERMQYPHERTDWDY
jgi:hypothetical protein